MKDEKKHAAPKDADSKETDPKETEVAASAEAASTPLTGAENAEAAAGERRSADVSAAPDPSVSRTGYADRGSRPGEECVCPDGRKGTVHRFDAGLICIPNHDQG